MQTFQASDPTKGLELLSNVEISIIPASSAVIKFSDINVVNTAIPEKTHKSNHLPSVHTPLNSMYTYNKKESSIANSMTHSEPDGSHVMMMCLYPLNTIHACVYCLIGSKA